MGTQPLLLMTFVSLPAFLSYSLFVFHLLHTVCVHSCALSLDVLLFFSLLPLNTIKAFSSFYVSRYSFLLYTFSWAFTVILPSFHQSPFFSLLLLAVSLAYRVRRWRKWGNLRDMLVTKWRASSEVEALPSAAKTAGDVCLSRAHIYVVGF